MKYIIMCGGDYSDRFKIPKPLIKVNGEVLVERTIKLLKENGIKDIAISTNNPQFDYLDVEKLRHNNKFLHGNSIEHRESNSCWLNAYYPSDEPCCYLHGDVYFSDDAIKKIINAKVKDTLFICTPDKQDGEKCELNTKGREPLGYKVQNQVIFRNAINDLKKMVDDGKFINIIAPFSWHLYKYLNGQDYLIKDWGKLNDIFDKDGDYLVINDYTTDVDYIHDITRIENCLKLGGEIKMVKVKAIQEFTYGNFDKINNLQRHDINKNEKGRLYTGDIFECTKEMAEYLTGNCGYVLVKVIEVIPEEVPVIENVEEKIEEIKESAKEEIKKTPKKRKKK